MQLGHDVGRMFAVCRYRVDSGTGGRARRGWGSGCWSAVKFVDRLSVVRFARAMAPLAVAIDSVVSSTRGNDRTKGGRTTNRDSGRGRDRGGRVVVAVSAVGFTRRVARLVGTTETVICTTQQRDRRRNGRGAWRRAVVGRRDEGRLDAA